jgi:hypothetical protein
MYPSENIIFITSADPFLHIQCIILTKVCLRIYNRQSQQRPFYRSRKGDSYGTEVVPKISLWSAVLNINRGNLIDYCPT